MVAQTSDLETQRHERPRNDSSKASSLAIGKKNIVDALPPRLTSTIPSAEHDSSTKPPADDAPDGGYGWVCVICMLLITANTWGVNGAFGIYLTHYIQTDTFPNTTETTYAFIGGLAIGQITFIAPLVTYVGKRLGTHPTLAIGIVLKTAALIASSFTKQVWQLFLAQGLCFGWGCSFLYVGAIGIVPQWFNKRRSYATAIASAGSGIGGMCWSLGTQAMIKKIGLPWAFRGTAIVTCVLNLVCALLMQDRNHHIVPNQKAFDLSLLKRPELLLTIAWACFSTLGYTMIIYSLPENALKLGLTTEQGAITGALANLGMGIGRPTIGFLSDRFGRLNMVTGATFLCTLYCLCIWTSATSYAQLLVFSILGGTVLGTWWATIAPVLVGGVGFQNLPAALSIVWTVVVLPNTFAEPIALKLRQYENPQYMPVALFAGFVFFAATSCMLLLRALTIEKQRVKSETAVHATTEACEKRATRLVSWPYEKIALAFAPQKV